MKKNDQELIKIIFSILLPPVAAYLQVGVTLHFVINVVLTLFGFLPGIVHALWLVLTKQKG